MKFNTLFILAGSFANIALGYREFDKIYATVSEVDLGHGTAVHKGVRYALGKPPGKHWYISNANGTEAPHLWYLPNMKTSLPAPEGEGVPATQVLSGSNTTNTADIELHARQRPPQYLNYYGAARCSDFDAQDRPVTLNRCVWNRSLVAWSSSFTPAGSTCRFIVNYYNSGCGFQSKCGGYISQTFDWVGCYNPPRVFCGTFAHCCLSGC